MTRISSLLVWFCALSSLRGGDLAVSATVVRVGFTADGMAACVVKAEVRNETKLPITVAMMTCGWDTSWFVKPNDSLRIRAWECKANFPRRYVFEPGGGYSFEFLLQARESNRNVGGQRIRVGFLYAPWDDKNPMFELEWKKTPGPDSPAIWSDEITLPEILRGNVDCEPTREVLPNKSLEATPGSVTPAASASGAPPPSAPQL